MPEPSPLLTDLYELAMLEAYSAHDMTETAVFELVVRKPPNRGFLMAAGLDQAVHYLANARFAPDDLAWPRASVLL
jgi:nicotinate phosphoribosyltransferase